MTLPPHNPRPKLLQEYCPGMIHAIRLPLMAISVNLVAIEWPIMLIELSLINTRIILHILVVCKICGKQLDGALSIVGVRISNVQDYRRFPLTIGHFPA